jgi:hypothetical protein
MVGRMSLVKSPGLKREMPGWLRISPVKNKGAEEQEPHGVDLTLGLAVIMIKQSKWPF